jgi:hypothetical protein
VGVGLRKGDDELREKFNGHRRNPRKRHLCRVLEGYFDFDIYGSNMPEMAPRALDRSGGDLPAGPDRACCHA